MDGNDIINLARKTYLDEFARFIGKQTARFKRGAAEVATTRTGETHLLGAHYRVDFVGQEEDQPRPIELVPDSRVRLDTVLDGMSGAMRVQMEQIVWDDVAIAHDLTGDVVSILQPWFDHWYDPNDKRSLASSGGITDVVHSLGVYPGQLVVDFGTASTSAFWSLIALLRDAGAQSVVISETRPPPPSR
jgi:hypothetical protein